jgi:hypothetical protein
VIGGGETYEAPMPEDFRATLPGVLTQVVAAFEGTTVRLYTNGRRLYTLTDRKFARGRVLRVFLGGQDDATHAVYLAGLRIGTGTARPGGVVAGAGQSKGTSGTGDSSSTSSAGASTGSTTNTGSTVQAAGTGKIATTAPPATAVLVGPQSGAAASAPAPETSLPLRRSIPAGTDGGVARPAALTPTDCSLLPNLRASAWGSTNTKVAWDRMSATCERLVQGPDEALTRYAMLRWPISSQTGCPATYEDLLRTPYTEGLNWRIILTPYLDCEWFSIDAWTRGTATTRTDGWSGWVPTSQVEDYGLEGGETYRYRIWPLFYVACDRASSPSCESEERVFPSSDASVTLPLQRVSKPAYYIVPPRVSLQAAVGRMTWYAYSANGDVDITYSWSPADKAVAYVLSFETRFRGSTTPLFNGTVTVPASATPTFTSEFYYEPAMVVRACIGIIVDPANPPDPRKGECIDTMVAE